MKFYTIEVDEKVWNYLKKNAEPFKDTPNSVLNRLIFGGGNRPASKITAPPRPYEKPAPKIEQKSKIEIQPEDDFTVDGIKLELENPVTPQVKPQEISSGTQRHSQLDDTTNLQLELDSALDSTASDDNQSISFDESFKPDKDIDDFISELEKSNTSDSLRDEFSDILKELPRENGDWQEISIQPKQDSNIIHATQPEKATGNLDFGKELQKPPEKKRPKLISFEDKLVYSLGERLKNQWGEFRQEGVGLLIFANKTVLCKFSKYNEKNAQWLWGVSQADRYAWGPQNWLALILENEDHGSYSFLLFNSQEAGVLFDQCKQTTGDKYITMLIDDAYESLRIQEWRHLDLRNRKKALPLFNPDDD